MGTWDNQLHYTLEKGAWEGLCKNRRRQEGPGKDNYLHSTPGRQEERQRTILGIVCLHFTSTVTNISLPNIWELYDFQSESPELVASSSHLLVTTGRFSEKNK